MPTNGSKNSLYSVEVLLFEKVGLLGRTARWQRQNKQYPAQRKVR